MADVIVYIGDDARFDFKAEQVTSSGIAAVPLPLGTKIFSGVKENPSTTNDPPTITKRNLAAGGTEQQARVTDATGGLFSVYLEEADTALLTAGHRYWIDGQPELADGTHWTAGMISFVAQNRVWRNPA